MPSTLRKTLTDGHTKRAISELLAQTKGHPDLHTQVIALSARYAHYERQKLGNLEDPAVLNIELNQINRAVLAVIGEWEKSESTVAGFFTQKRLLWLGGSLVALLAILANLAEVLGYLGFQPNADGKIANVTVMVEDKGGAFVMRQQGKIVMMVEGGDVKQEDIDSKGAASFKNVKVGDKVQLKVDFSEPYHPLVPDSLYTIPADGRIHLRVGLQNLGRVFGRVLYHDQEMPGVIVAVGDLRDTTDDLGRYEILIPETDQRQEQEVFFKAEGFKSMTKKAFPQTNQPLNVVMEK
jgi:hypothetical protein